MIRTQYQMVSGCKHGNMRGLKSKALAKLKLAIKDEVQSEFSSLNIRLKAHSEEQCDRNTIFGYISRS